VLREEPDATGVWTQLAHIATLAERYPVALDAYQHVIALTPLDAVGYLGAANVSLKAHKLDEAQLHAERGVEAGGGNPQRLAEAHAVLASIALARHDASPEAREQIEAARDRLEQRADELSARIG